MPYLTTLILVLALSLPFGAQAASSQGKAPESQTTEDSVTTNYPDIKDIQNFARVYDLVRKAYVEKLTDEQLMQAAITGMLHQLDPHSAYFDKKEMSEFKEETRGKYVGLGVKVTSRNQQLVVVAPIDDTPAAKAGLKSGDVILEIDGKPVDPKNIHQSINRLRGKKGSKVTLTLMEHGTKKPVTKTLVRTTITESSTKIHTLEKGYVDIRISQFQPETAHQLRDKLTRYIHRNGLPLGVILDLRSNPGGLVSAAATIADTFLDKGTIVTTRGRIKSSNLIYQAHPGDLLKGAPMIVLVNHGTASAAEILTGALSDNHRALVMGQRTFGKGVVQTMAPIDDEHTLKLTTARYYTPDGTSIQAEGITPDIIIPDIKAQQVSSQPQPIQGEADLLHHLGNTQQKSKKKTSSLAATTKLVEHDYFMAQALNVLKGIVLSQTQASVIKED